MSTKQFKPVPVAEESKSDAVAEVSQEGWQGAGEEPLQVIDTTDKSLPEPNLGDLGCIEENDDNDLDVAAKKQLENEEPEMSIKNAELTDLVEGVSVHYTPEYMRQAESEYQMIGELESSSKQIEEI